MTKTDTPCKHILRILSVIAQARPSLISATDMPESADAKLAVRETETEVSVVLPGTMSVDVLDRVVAVFEGM